MKILLTGQPGIGKSSVIEKFIKSFSGESAWVLTKEILDKNIRRVGFKAINSSGKEGVISHKFELESNLIIGSNKVNLSMVDKLFTDLFSTNGKLIILDEIGPIQLLSPTFKKGLDKIFKKHDADLLATIHLDNKEIKNYKELPGVIICVITEGNRDQIPDILLVIYKNLENFRSLHKTQQEFVLSLLKSYLENSSFTQINKLFNKAIKYVLEKKITKIDDNHSVRGDHGEYLVKKTEETFECNCNLYLGKGEYKKSEECSHIQAVKLFNSHKFI